jgi:hypothetical protein
MKPHLLILALLPSCTPIGPANPLDRLEAPEIHSPHIIHTISVAAPTFPIIPPGPAIYIPPILGAAPIQP